MRSEPSRTRPSRYRGGTYKLSPFRYDWGEGNASAFQRFWRAVLAVTILSMTTARARGDICAYLTQPRLGRLAVVDVASNAVVDQIDCRPCDPRLIVVTPDGSRAYVLEGTGNTMEIDLATHMTVGNIPGAPGHEALAIFPDGSKVLAGYIDGVNVLETAANTSLGIVPVTLPTAIAVHPNGDRFYVTSQNGILVVNSAALEIITALDTGGFPTGIAVSNDRLSGYAPDASRDLVSVIDIAQNQLHESIPIRPCRSVDGVAHCGPTRAVARPGTSLVYILDTVERAVDAIDSNTNQIVGRTSLGPTSSGSDQDVPRPSEMAFTPGGEILYVVGGRFQNGDGILWAFGGGRADEMTLPDIPGGIAIAEVPHSCERQVGLCAGDCNSDGEVVINELVLAVSIALGTQPLASCSQCDLDRDGVVTISELIRAVDSGLNGCGV